MNAGTEGTPDRERAGPPDKTRARRLYRRLLAVHPRPHRERFGPDMEEAFLSLLARDSARSGRWGRLRCWTGAAVDAVLSGAALRWGRGPAVANSKEGGDMMATFLSDVRFAVRALARRPVFAATAVLTLALGIGANAAVFTLVKGLLLTPLPYDQPDELVTIWAENPARGWTRTDVNAADAWEWRERSRSLDDLAVFDEGSMNLTGGGPPEQVESISTSPNLFRLLGRTPALGRDFLDDEVGEGNRGVVVLTDAFWSRRFGRDPTILGSTLVLDGRSLTVVGILPEDFRFLDERPDVFVPLSADPATAERGGHNHEALARLAEGITVEQARADLADLTAAQADAWPGTNRDWTATVVSTHDEMVGPVARDASFVFMAAVGLLLLMACVNVANLLLARASGREREMAVRTALGAGKARVVRQLLTESLVLATAGGLGGLLVGYWGFKGILAVLPSTLPPVFRFGMDLGVVAYVAAVTLAAGAAFGVAPAFRTAERTLAGIRDGRALAGGRFGSTLIVTQTALAVVLLVVGGLLVKSVAGMRQQDLGFDPAGLLTARVVPPAAAYPGDPELRAFWSSVEERVRAIRGVTEAGTTQSHPLGGSNWGAVVWIAGLGASPDDGRTVRTTYASPGYLEALRVDLLAGRRIEAQDGAKAPRVAVVNQAFVDRHLAQGTDPLSVSLSTDASGADPIRVVGVVGTMVEERLEQAPDPAWYLPADQHVARGRTLMVRSGRDAADLLPDVQRAVWDVDPGLPVSAVETMAELVRRRVGGFAAIGILMGVFALVSLVLGAVGIYGVTAHAAGRRTAEIGLRLAMGAERADVTRLVVGQGALRAGAGLLLGLVAAAGLARLLGSVLVGVRPHDPAIYGAVVALLAGVSFLGLWLPARKAASIDPVRALSAEG